MNKSSKLLVLLVFLIGAVVVVYQVAQKKSQVAQTPIANEHLVTPLDTPPGGPAASPVASKDQNVTAEDLLARVRNHIESANTDKPATASPGAIPSESAATGGSTADSSNSLTFGGAPLAMNSTSASHDAPILAPATPETDSSGTPPASSDVPTLSSTAASAAPVVAAPATQPSSDASAIPVLPAKAATPAAHAASPSTYTIQSGDTFSSIARKLYGSDKRWVDIAQANPLVDPSHLKVGQIIKLPGAGSTTDAEETRHIPGSLAPDSPALPAGAKAYTVRGGDTLSSIASQFYHSSGKWKQIYEANKATIGDSPNDLREGMKLVIPAAK